MQTTVYAVIEWPGSAAIPTLFVGPTEADVKRQAVKLIAEEVSDYAPGRRFIPDHATATDAEITAWIDAAKQSDGDEPWIHIVTPGVLSTGA